ITPERGDLPVWKPAATRRSKVRPRRLAGADLQSTLRAGRQDAVLGLEIPDQSGHALAGGIWVPLAGTVVGHVHPVGAADAAAPRKPLAPRRRRDLEAGRRPSRPPHPEKAAIHPSRNRRPPYA